MAKIDLERKGEEGEGVRESGGRGEKEREGGERLREREGGADRWTDH